jgi:hypothetical protein
MAPSDNPDHFEEEAQPDLFGAEPVPAYRPDPEKVRRRLEEILLKRASRRNCRGNPQQFPFIAPFSHR